ncbi:hypothetical protein M8J77_016226 [Diaphorina citri]|nr:hypothetical protein M8J77_016226 [Diaphorina citri]
MLSLLWAGLRICEKANCMACIAGSRPRPEAELMLSPRPCIEVEGRWKVRLNEWRWARSSVSPAPVFGSEDHPEQSSVRLTW